MAARAALILAALAACVVAADPVELRLADGGRLRERLAASFLAVLADDPGVVALRTRFGPWLDLHGDPAHLRNPQVRLLEASDRSRLRWAAQAELGPRAPMTVRRMAGGMDMVALLGADEAWQDAGSVLARFGGTVTAGRPADALPLPPASTKHDAEWAIDVPALARTLRVLRPQTDTDWFDVLAERLSSVVVGLNLAADGTRSSGRLTGEVGWLRRIDPGIISRLPPTAWSVQLAGIDGAILRPGLGVLVEALATRLPPGAPSVPALVDAIGGTVALAHLPGAPEPGWALLVPRHPVVDALAAAWGAQPGPGFAVVLPSGSTTPIMLAADARWWLATTEGGLAAGWATAPDHGFAVTALGRALAAALPAEAVLASATDPAGAARQLLGRVQAAIAPAETFDHAEKQALVRAVARLGAALPPGWLWARPDGAALELRGGGGDVTWLALPVWFAGVHLPSLAAATVAGAEEAVIRELKTRIFPAQVQFQGGCYQDADLDNVGEYGLLSELSGRRATAKVPAGMLGLLDGPLATGDTAHGFRFAVFLPDGRGGAVGEPAGDGPRPSIVDGVEVLDANAQEQRWVAYAWPLDPDAGTRVFAIDATGQVRASAWHGGEPAWNNVYGGGAWEDEPSWDLVPPPGRRRR